MGLLRALYGLIVRPGRKAGGLWRDGMTTRMSKPDLPESLDGPLKGTLFPRKGRTLNSCGFRLWSL